MKSETKSYVALADAVTQIIYVVNVYYKYHIFILKVCSCVTVFVVANSVIYFVSFIRKCSKISTTNICKVNIML